MTALRFGLTGGIGSGKSTVGAMLASLGAAVIDTDLIARRLTLPGGAAIEAIRSTFGTGFISADGGLDRPRMRQAAFDDSATRGRLEAILHPLISVEVDHQADSMTTAPALVFDVPLLVESGRWRSRVDAVWLVDCDEALQAERVAARPGWSEAAARAVIAQQTSRPARRAAADAVVHNQGLSLAELAAEVHELWRIALAGR
ncbi:MAG: dephospho-CoA kinase [Pseudomonadota bacterium]|nr:dephospho-CoA kinase [Pseudomonadota bacterium]